MKNGNSFYGLYSANSIEIAKIVHSYLERGIGTVYDRFNSPPPPIYIGPVKVKTLKERLEEATMHADCEFCVKRDICTRDVPKPCKYKYTEEERIADQMSTNGVLPGMYLPKTYKKETWQKEDNKMNATSVQVINNVKDMNVTIEKSPLEETRIIISVSTDDDTYEFNCSGPGCEKFLSKKYFVPVKEYEYVNNQLMEREKELINLRKEAAEWLRLRDEVRREKNKEINKLWGKLHEAIRDSRRLEYKLEEKDKMIKDLQSKYDLERGANEAHHKFFRQYAGDGVEVDFNYVIDDGEEVSYVIVDKDYIDKLRKEFHDLVAKNTELKTRLHDTAKEGDYVMYNGSPYTASDIERLLTGIRQLEELKTPTIDNFADEEPSSRRDILRCAEKCVCGQREQDYGTPESNFQLIADLWNGYLGFVDHPQDQIQAKDVAMLMALMKIARIRNGGGSGDSFVDLAGYAACGGEIWAGEKKQ